MRKVFVFAAAAALTLSSCVSKQKYVELEEMQKATSDKLSNTKMELAAATAEKNAQAAELAALRASSSDLMKQVGDLTRMSATNAENMEKTLESINEKEVTITNLQDAMNRKDSVTLALVTSLKGALGDMNDEDVQISVEKGVVYVNLSDKLMFRPGSAYVSTDAKTVLGKVAKIMAAKPTLEILVEGHTDTDPIATDCIKDNWELSARRATNIVRVLQNDFEIAPERMSAAGRGEYVPVASNDTREGRAANRRTRIVVLPKLDEFNKMIQEGLK
ncbi:MAG: OmpA/MotB family protein [Schleiferiaceae bacterium]